MIKIKKIGEIKSVKVAILPGWKDSFHGILVEDIVIPGIFFMGERWELEHSCNYCGKSIYKKSSYEDYFIVNYLSIGDLKNIDFVNTIGQLFELELHAGQKVDDSGYFHYYTLTKVYKQIALFAYYRCPNCLTQYIYVFANLYGDDDRFPQPNKVYIEKLLQVRFDHDTFMREYQNSVI